MFQRISFAVIDDFYMQSVRTLDGMLLKCARNEESALQLSGFPRQKSAISFCVMNKTLRLENSSLAIDRHKIHRMQNKVQIDRHQDLILENFERSGQ